MVTNSFFCFQERHLSFISNQILTFRQISVRFYNFRMVLSIFGDLIGRLLGSEERSYSDDDIISTCFRPGIIVDFGIAWVQFVRKILMAGVAVGSSPVPTSTKCDQICRASELPIYMNEDDCKKYNQSEQLCPPKAGILESTFGALRRTVWEAKDKYSEYERQAEDVYQKGHEYATSMYKYLSQDADDLTRAGAIGLGTLTGLVLGLRGGIFRKAFYSSIGAYGMCAVCYPNQTADYTRQAIKESRKYATIGYNFAYGVKKDDIPLALPQLPKLPSSMNEVWDMAGSIGKSASSLIAGKTQEKQAEAAVEEELKDQAKSTK